MITFIFLSLMTLINIEAQVAWTGSACRSPFIAGHDDRGIAAFPAHR